MSLIFQDRLYLVLTMDIVTREQSLTIEFRTRETCLECEVVSTSENKTLTKSVYFKWVS